MATAYGANLENKYYDDSTSTGANFYNQAGPNTTSNFLLGGIYSNGSFNYGNSRGYYWSSTSSSYSGSGYAMDLFFSSSRVDSADYSNRSLGFSVRCLAK